MSVSDQDRVVQIHTWWGSITSGFANSGSKKLRPARVSEPSIKDAAIQGNWIGNDLRKRNGQPSIKEGLYVNRQHVHALNKYSQQKKKIMPSVDISTPTINKQRIALSGRFCWRNSTQSTSSWPKSQQLFLDLNIGTTRKTSTKTLAGLTKKSTQKQHSTNWNQPQGDQSIGNKNIPRR
jgi:hypothetical protein